MRNTVIHFLKPESEKEAEEFAVWAFGDGYLDFDTSIQFLQAWNLIHGEELFLKPDGMLDQDIKNMVELYKHQ